MSKIYVALGDAIDTIAWCNQDGSEESIEDVGDTIEISAVSTIATLYKKDIPKLEAAIAKARELGWF